MLSPSPMSFPHACVPKRWTSACRYALSGNPDSTFWTPDRDIRERQGSFETGSSQTKERNASMDFSKNVGMLLLGIWLIVSGLIALVPAVFFNGLGVIMAILAILAGVFILMRK
jgi:hypothetical protein